MNDLETIKQVFTDLKVEYDVVTANEEKGCSPVMAKTYGGYAFWWDMAIKLNAGIGYMGFECLFYFLDGKYQGHGLWE